jgi:hypothetical protein
MTESDKTEIQYWQARTDDMQVSLERLREERDELAAKVRQLYVSNELLVAELRAAQVTVDRLRLHLQQGVEL